MRQQHKGGGDALEGAKRGPMRRSQAVIFKGYPESDRAENNAPDAGRGSNEGDTHCHEQHEERLTEAPYT